MLASQKSYGQRGKVVPLGNLCCPGDDNSNSELGPCGFGAARFRPAETVALHNLELKTLDF